MPSPVATCLVALITSLLAVGTHSAPASELRFNRDIRPILSDRCFHCHGPDAAARKARLRLDDPASAFELRDGLAPIAPGAPDRSLLVRRITATDPEDMMPPPESHLALNDAEKQLLIEWIAQGAKYEPHWAFVSPARTTVPVVGNRDWPRDDLDRFVLARLEKVNLHPAPEADRSRWLRRVTFDLTGLPPTPEEIDSFLADESDTAHERVVDRLLASPAFGERMAVPWLDAVRYADSYGYQSDLLSPTWPYRDWLVDAFNRDLPYDRFIIEQLAGDLLPDPTREQRLATAFNRLHRQTNEGGSIEEEWRLEYVADRVHTFGSVFLGLTLECARCHDHKFDPVSQRDYYSLAAFFNSIDESGTYDNTPRVPTPSLLLPTAAQEAAIAHAVEELQRQNTALEQVITGAEPSFQNWLRTANSEPIIPGLVGHFTFDGFTQTNRFANATGATNISGPINGNALVEGRQGRAVRFTGDDVLQIPGVLSEVDAWSQYTIAFWLLAPEALTSAVVFHCTEGSDTSYHGTELSIRDGKLFFVIKRFWPGNAIAVQTVEPLPKGRWAHVAAVYDGSGDARGLQLFVDGEPAPLEVVRNSLFKSPENRDFTLNFGERSRSPGLKDALFDELRIHDRPLAAVEIAQLHDGRSLREALANRNVAALRSYYAAALSEPVRRARAARALALKALLQIRNPVQETSVMAELSAPRETHLLARGAYDAPTDETTRVFRDTPAFLPPFPREASRDRLGLARWLVDRKHPLTARVEVNRIWQMLFGHGLAAQADNFGSQAPPPGHPELLDRLALDFIESGWRIKPLLKRIVLSATYRQDSALRPELIDRDPENLLHARGPSQRLTAEMIRDTALAASGLLDGRRGGPPVSPYLPGDLWRESNSMSPPYRQSVGQDLHRRSLYTVWKRTAPMPNIMAFDAPSREVCTAHRISTTTPQQVYVLLNDPQFVEAARVLAEKIIREVEARPELRIGHAFRRLAGRAPRPDETDLLVNLLTQQIERFQAEPDRAAKLISVGEGKPDPAFDPILLAAHTVVVQAILNLDATLWNR